MKNPLRWVNMLVGHEVVGSKLSDGAVGLYQGKAPRFSNVLTGSSRRRLQPMFLSFTWLLLLLVMTWTPPFLLCAEANHVLAVDLGVDWAKAATLGGGSGTSVHPSVVLNDQANRKSPQCIAFRFLPYEMDDVLQMVERVFAEQAQALEPRFPAQVVCGSSLLAGRGAWRDSPEKMKTNDTGALLGGSTDRDMLTADVMASLTFAVVPDSSGKKASVRVVGGRGSNTSLEFFTEELIGMYFAYLKRITERHLDGEPVRHLVVTVPILASIAQRQTIVDAAAVAGLRAVRLVHGTTAAAVQLAYINTEQFFAAGPEKGPSRYIMLYDMGSQRTEVAVYTFSPSRRHLGTITLLAAVSNSTVGGRAFDQCIARYVERELFPRAKPTPIKPVLGVPTVAARKAAVSLLRAANNAREQLSVNQEAPLVVQGVRENDGGDFASSITRATFERECAHLFDEAVRLRDEAIAQTNGAVSSVRDLTRFEVIGGATRMPKLIERLSEGYGGTVDRTLNSDEAAVVGATYMGAARASIPLRGFDVVEPLMNDVYFSITPPLPAEGEGKASTRHLIFAKAQTLVPAVQSVRFQNRTADFALTLEDENRRFARVTSVQNVKESLLAAHALPSRLAERRGKYGKGTHKEETMSLEHTEVVVEVTMSESGIPFVSNAYLRASYMKETLTEEKNNDILTNATQNVSARVAKTGENVPEGGESSPDPAEEDLKPPKVAEDDDEVVNEEEEEKEGEEQNKGNNDNPVKERRENDTDDDNTVAEGARNATTLTRTMRHVVRSFPLRLVSGESSVGINLNKKETVAARDRLYAFQRVDDERLLRSALRNDLESLILNYKSRDTWNRPEENNGDAQDWREVVRNVAEWLENADDNVATAALQSQLQRLRDL